MDFTELGLKIKKRREQLNLLQWELAEKVGTTREYISFIETGKKRPSLEMIYKIAEVLKVKVSELVDQGER